MYKLLICGSRLMTEPMKTLAQRSVVRALGYGWAIVVGDASGIDFEVQQAACFYGIPLEIFGITERPRNICCDKHLANYTQVKGNFYARDEHMVREADRVFAIRNLEAKTNGTLHTYKYAVEIGKPADIKEFLKEGYMDEIRDKAEILYPSGCVVTYGYQGRRYMVPAMGIKHYSELRDEPPTVPYVRLDKLEQQWKDKYGNKTAAEVRGYKIR